MSHLMIVDFLAICVCEIDISYPYRRRKGEAEILG